jgi:hypothetical protein
MTFVANELCQDICNARINAAPSTMPASSVI